MPPWDCDCRSSPNTWQCLSTLLNRTSASNAGLQAMLSFFEQIAPKSKDFQIKIFNQYQFFRSITGHYLRTQTHSTNVIQPPATGCPSESSERFPTKMCSKAQPCELPRVNQMRRIWRCQLRVESSWNDRLFFVCYFCYKPFLFSQGFEKATIVYNSQPFF